ncbi:hypothetical protein I5E68_02035 [Novosphingobium sp. YJ-S2-02]|uniref:Uncharacterized protein n=1 Tax=Novosphingobium aureum TaxID=2792964 RepID=A0A931MJS5_9SPHN|nr:hypothetical protein [Novosphingobium aureum]MBH0111729.1 hypothetical protein [Novosphingobium aureum]
MNRPRADFDRLRRRIRLVCLFVVPVIACTITGLALWSDARANRPFEVHPIFSGLGMIGWGFVVFVLSGPTLTAIERLRARLDEHRARRRSRR